MSRLWTPRWIALHLGMVVLVASFLGLGWWQVSRAAAGGNASSWGYAVEWPVFAGFVVFVWLREVRQTLRQAVRPERASAEPPPRTTDPALGVSDHAPVGSPASASRPALGIRRPVRTVASGRASNGHPSPDELVEPAGDDELAAYNRYLAWLREHPHARPTDYPG